MIIWINGPYGVGKTTLAEELLKKLPDGFIFDAEEVGNAVRDNMPKKFFRETFEEFPLWHETCRRLLQNLASVYKGDILVPMTLVFPESADEIIGKLREKGIGVLHVMLEADENIILERILSRGEKEDCWCAKNIERCVLAQKDMPCDLRVQSAEKSPKEIAEEVIKFVR